MKLQSVVEVLSAGHQTYLVDAPKEFSSRGGMMFVAPVGHLKTTITKTLDCWKPQALVTSDLTIRELSNMREDFATGKMRTLAFMELQKVYARNSDVSANVEGALHQMAEEGWRQPNFEPQNMTLKEARAFIVAAMPTPFYKKHWQAWGESGWQRRFLWCHFQLANPEIIMESIDRWQPIDFGKIIYAMPAANSIPFNVTRNESNFVRSILRKTKAQYEAVPFVLLKKIIAVLKWRHADKGPAQAAKKAMELISDFAECLVGVADLQIDLPLTGSDDEPETPPRREAVGERVNPFKK